MRHCPLQNKLKKKKTNLRWVYRFVLGHNYSLSLVICYQQAEMWTGLDGEGKMRRYYGMGFQFWKFQFWRNIPEMHGGRRARDTITPLKPTLKVSKMVNFKINWGIISNLSEKLETFHFRWWPPAALTVGPIHTSVHKSCHLTLKTTLWRLESLVVIVLPDFKFGGARNSAVSVKWLVSAPRPGQW